MTYEAARASVLAGLLLGVTLAGCIGGDDALSPQSLLENEPRFDGTWTFREPFVLDGSGSVVPAPLDPATAGLWVERLIPGDGAEPNIGVTSSGAVFVTSGDVTYRSLDQGATWEPSHTLESPNHPATEDYFRSFDPMLWVDALTDRIYASHLGPSTWCTHLAWSDDDGETWTDRPGACFLPGIDHQKVATSPHGPSSPFGLVPAVYPNALYICVNKGELGTTCTVSHDGGLTYAYETQLHGPDLRCSNINGHPAAFPDGTVAVPLGGFDSGDGCDRPLTVYVTEDDGLTWQRRQCAEDRLQTEIDPDITVTPDGTAYLLFRDKDQRVHLARSTDKFQTCEVFDVSPPDHTMNVFAGITSGSDGRIAFAFLGTRTPQERGATPSNATAGSTWHLYVTTSTDADGASPTFLTRQVTPEEDPVQIGCIWLRGGGGGANECRNLLDFIDVHRDSEGRMYAAFTDGCTPRIGCSGTPDRVGHQSSDRQVSVAVQAHGESLLADVGILPPIALERPGPSSS